eukprot:CAMPEP_0170455082 /NCGR_PEP_ID=MMETSP0123-20130129/3135_1 /TAXON_ID=182087 /ORGANISM="Favella ehrenbergii, Strain Fehren 1" /LENGTH=152 /DNA_ID=CAMNT_0010718041 /DNA_START=835 /DNA_END=1293 /DNA_ORIENTATION=+
MGHAGHGAASRVGFLRGSIPDEAEEERDKSSVVASLDKKQSALEKYQIADHETPWHNIKEQGVDFEDYREKIKSVYDKGKEVAEKERNRLGDLIKESEEIEELDAATEDERDRKLFDDYLKKGLVNIKNLVLKNPLHRTDKENEFLILYLKH